MQRLIHTVNDMAVFVRALHNVPESVVSHVKTNFSDRFNQLFDVESNSINSIAPSDVQHAQFQIIRTLRTLEYQGDISSLRQLKQRGKS